ncbi:MAG TPA: PLP-dependent aminotransferase family protein [Vicinamibacterales bacterium]|nr:PLP-dependent aminotransferase family protein [Vicinamibacterales bacterium]
MWAPELDAPDGPRYLALAEMIGEAVRRGDLAPGDRLPTHREMADRLGLALTTVTRGYAEAQRRGLVRGEVGRGTFVRGAAAARLDGAGEPIDLRSNSLLPYGLMPELAARIQQIVSRSDLSRLFGYAPHRGLERHREAGASWLAQTGLRVSHDEVLITAGAQHAMAVVFATILAPGDTLLVEHVTYAGMKALANLLRVRLEPLPMDGHGLLPDGLRAALVRRAAAALYCMSALQNPTTAVMTEDRCRQIAAVLDEFGVPVVEDDSYGFVLPGRTPLSARVAQGYYITGTSKSLLPALRIGFLHAPQSMVPRLEATLSSTVFQASPMTSAIVAEWIEDGTAERVVRWKRDELTERQRIVRRVLADQDYMAHPGGPHGWLRIPEPWSVRDFTTQAALRGVAVTSSDEFAVGRDAPHAVRLSVGPVAERARLEQAVTALAQILAEGPEPIKTLA